MDTTECAICTTVLLKLFDSTSDFTLGHGAVPGSPIAERDDSGVVAPVDALAMSKSEAASTRHVGVQPMRRKVGVAGDIAGRIVSKNNSQGNDIGASVG